MGDEFLFIESVKAQAGMFHFDSGQELEEREKMQKIRRKKREVKIK